MSSMCIITVDGWTFVCQQGRPMPEQSIEEMMRFANVAIDNRGRCRKNRYGAHGPEPVEGQSPLYGLPGVEKLFNYLCTDVQPAETGKHTFEKLDEKNIFKVALSVLQARGPVALGDRIQLRHATAYRFGGIVEGEGFLVTVALAIGCEGWGLIKHYEDPFFEMPRDKVLTPRVLVEDIETGIRFWATPYETENAVDLSVLDIEDEKEAIRLALDVTDGCANYEDWPPREEEPSDEG